VSAIKGSSAEWGSTYDIGISRFLLNSHTHSPLARAMHVALRNSKVVDKFQDPLYIFLELVRAGVMHGHLWTGRAFSGGPSFGTDDEKSCMLLIMRVLSIVPLNFKVYFSSLLA